MTTWFSTQDLHALGLSANQITRRVEAGELLRLAPGLYSTGRPAPRDALRALQKRYPSLVFTAETALALHGGGTITAPALGYVSHGARSISTPALVATRSRRLEHGLIDGLRLTDPLRAGVDALTLPPHYRRTVEKHYEGWRGKNRFHLDFHRLRPPERRLALKLTDGAVIGASSEWERQMFRELTAAGLYPVANFALGPYHWDFGFPDSRTAVDLDSWKFHGPGVTTSTFIVDRWKTNHAVRVGWLPLRFTDLDTEVICAEVVDQIARSIRREHPGNQPVWEYHPNLY